MLCQLHHQFKDGTTDMRAQKEIAEYNEFKRFFLDTALNHPLPEGAIWLAVEEGSPLFWKVPA